MDLWKQGSLSKKGCMIQGDLSFYVCCTPGRSIPFQCCFFTYLYRLVWNFSRILPKPRRDAGKRALSLPQLLGLGKSRLKSQTTQQTINFGFSEEQRKLTPCCGRSWMKHQLVIGLAKVSVMTVGHSTLELRCDDIGNRCIYVPGNDGAGF